MRKSNEQSLGEVINQLLDTYRLRGKLNELKIIKIWEQAMGKAISNRTTSIHIRDKTLFIKLTSAPLREELLYQREKIKDLMNKELNGNYIGEVVLS